MNVKQLPAIFLFILYAFFGGVYAQIIPANLYKELPKNVVPPVNFNASNLPVIRINTNGQTIEDEPAIIVDFGIIWNGEGIVNTFDDPFNEYEGKVKIEIRGHGSQQYPKKAYRIEMVNMEGEDIDTSFLNFPTEEDWILYAPYTDKTLMRNVLTFHLMNSMGQYAVRTRFVELLINEDYKGVYVLMEKIKRDENRVNIAKLKPEDIEGDQLTGGYIFKHDKGEQDWYSEFPAVDNANYAIGFQYVYPKKSKIVPEQEVYLQTYVNDFEQAIHSPSYHNNEGKRYDEYIDINSFAETFLINELSKNLDAYRISSFFHKKKNSNGGKIHAGPAWDFNLSFRNGDYCEADNHEEWMYYEFCGNGDPFWWHNMLEDTVFANAVKCKWEILRASVLAEEHLLFFINKQANLLASANVRNFERWDILGQYVWPNPEPIATTYAEEIQQLKTFIELRLQWMDENMMGNCWEDIMDNIRAVDEQEGVEISPNPFVDNLTIKIEDKSIKNINIAVYDVLGNLVFQQQGAVFTTENTFEIRLTHLRNGVYFLNIEIGSQFVSKKIFKIM